MRLAVALLADRNGVIDVDLPLSGSINDPQFSVWPLVWKGIVNLIVKAVTSPMSLLTGGSGGSGGDSSAIAFDPGSSALNAPAKESLDKIAKALVDRPTLRLTVSRHGQPGEGAHRLPEAAPAAVDAGREAPRRGAGRQGCRPRWRRSPMRSTPELLTAIYKRADITKPRNMVGLAKDLPVADMENLLMANVPVDEEVIRQLAVERGGSVRDYLLEQKVPSERLFLGAVRVQAGSGDLEAGRRTQTGHAIARANSCSQTGPRGSVKMHGSPKYRAAPCRVRSVHLSSRQRHSLP